MKRVLLGLSFPLATGVILVILLATAAIAEDKPALLLAEKYHQDIDLAAYWVSEKLDGVRAFWDGKQLISRGGNNFAAHRGLPPTSRLSSWMVSCGPAAGNLKRRYPSYPATRLTTAGVRCATWSLTCPRPPVLLMNDYKICGAPSLRRQVNFSPSSPQHKVSDHKSLLEMLDTVVSNGV